uniref:hypothetical protein n=1 Tax=Fodinicurvata sp. EGI_FJ10296 TaxID=3231908 RepID=UPI003451561D
MTTSSDRIDEEIEIFRPATEDGYADDRANDGRHLSTLAEAVAGGDPALFADYGLWLRSMLSARGVRADDANAS